MLERSKPAHLTTWIKAVAALIGALAAVYGACSSLDLESEVSAAMPGLDPTPKEIRKSPDEEMKPESGEPAGDAMHSGRQASELTVDGEWVFQVNGSAGVDSSGRKRRGNFHAEIAMRLSQQGQHVQGDYLWASGNACTKAVVVGEMIDGHFDFTIHYKGNCCGGAKMDFSGKLLSPFEIEGRFEPNGIPPNRGCNIWWASIVGLKNT